MKTVKRACKGSKARRGSAWAGRILKGQLRLSAQHNAFLYMRSARSNDAVNGVHSEEHLPGSIMAACQFTAPTFQETSGKIC